MSHEIRKWVRLGIYFLGPLTARGGLRQGQLVPADVGLCGEEPGGLEGPRDLDAVEAAQLLVDVLVAAAQGVLIKKTTEHVQVAPPHQ